MNSFVVPVDMRDRRQASRMTQEDVAQRLHITRIHANRIENGARPLTLDIALDLVDLFRGLTVRRAGKTYLITPDTGSPTPPDRPDRRPNAYASLSPVEKVVRLAKECAEAKAQADDLPRNLLNPQTRREHMKRMLKEGLEADMVLEALLASADPALLSEAAAMSEAELEAEMGMSA